MNPPRRRAHALDGATDGAEGSSMDGTSAARISAADDVDMDAMASSGMFDAIGTIGPLCHSRPIDDPLAR